MSSAVDFTRIYEWPQFIGGRIYDREWLNDHGTATPRTNKESGQ